MQDYRKLDVWREAHQLTLDAYRLTKAFPSEERFGLSSQLRRSAASVPTNIAEGCGRQTPRDTAHFFQIAIGSTNEAEYQALLARDLGYVTDEQHSTFAERVSRTRRMLSGLSRRVRNSLG